MTTQIMVIGLGQFGVSLARTLAERRVEVLAVDSRQDRVQSIANIVSEAVCLDAMDEQSLARTAPERRDVCVVTIGLESREASIIVTALLRQMGAKRIVARAADELHERILRLVGAHEIVNPERAFGERLATKLVFSGVIEELPLGDDLVITEFRPPAAAVGRTLIALALPRKHEITVVAVRRAGADSARVMLPNPNEPLKADDILVVVAPPGAVARFTRSL